MALKESKANTSKIMLILGGTGISIFLLFVLVAVYLSGSDKRAIQAVVNQVDVNYYVNSGKIKQLVSSMSRVDVNDCPDDFKKSYLGVIYAGQDFLKAQGEKVDMFETTEEAYNIGKGLGKLLNGDRKDQKANEATEEAMGWVAGYFGAVLSAGADLESGAEVKTRSVYLTKTVRYLEAVALQYNVKM